jgi:hypothetical protein
MIGELKTCSLAVCVDPGKVDVKSRALQRNVSHSVNIKLYRWLTQILTDVLTVVDVKSTCLLGYNAM